MKGKQVVLGIVLFDFLALTVWAVYQVGYIGFFAMMMTNAATITVFVDLVIALTLILGWMWRDANERGVSFLPYMLLTLALGSVGPLLYLIRHVFREESSTVPLTAQTARG